MSNYWTEGRGRKLARRRLLGWGAASAGVGALSLAGIACGDSSSNSTSTPGGAGSTPGASPSAGTPKQGGKVTFAYSNVPQNLDVQRIVSPTLGSAACLVMNRLLRDDPHADPNEYKIQNEIAESYQQPDDLTYVFKLRQDVKWQDADPYNGRGLVAGDIIKAYQRMGAKDPSAIWAYLVSWIDSMEASDDYTLTIKAKEPNARALGYLAFYQSPIVPIECVDKFGDLQKPESWVGTGAYKLTAWQPGVGFQFDKNPNYWENGFPYLDHVDLNEVTDLSSQLSAFIGGNLDVMDSIDPTVVKTVQQQASGAKLVSNKGVGGWSYAWNVKSGSPFADPRVRKAFDLSIDRESMMSSIAGDGNADLRTGPLNQGFVEWARSDADIKKDVVFDLKQAKELLTQAGHDTLATQLLGNNDTEQAWITWALNQGKKSGITINPDVVERTVYLTAQTQHKWNYGQVYSIRAYPDPDDYLYPLFVTGQSKNYGDVSDPTLDELITKQRQEFDHEKRKAILQEIDARWNKDFNYHTFSYTSKRVDGVSKRFSNYVPRPYDYTGVRYAWVS